MSLGQLFRELFGITKILRSLPKLKPMQATRMKLELPHTVTQFFLFVADVKDNIALQQHYTEIKLQVQDILYRSGLGAVAESVEHGFRVQETVASNPRSSQTNDLKN